LRQIGNLDISTGHGTDYIYFSSRNGRIGFDFFIDGSVSINTGVAPDHIEFRTASIFGPSQITGDLAVELGQGNDYILVATPVLVDESAYLGGGQGNDRIYDRIYGDLNIIADDIVEISFEN